VAIKVQSKTNLEVLEVLVLGVKKSQAIVELGGIENPTSGTVRIRSLDCLNRHGSVKQGSRDRFMRILLHVYVHAQVSPRLVTSDRNLGTR
jgi:hypothetical protein